MYLGRRYGSSLRIKTPKVYIPKVNLSRPLVRGFSSLRTKVFSPIRMKAFHLKSTLKPFRPTFKSPLLTGKSPLRHRRLL